VNLATSGRERPVRTQEAGAVEIVVYRTATVEAVTTPITDALNRRGLSGAVRLSSLDPYVDVLGARPEDGPGPTAVLFLTLDRVREAWQQHRFSGAAALDYHTALVKLLFARGAREVVVVAPLPPIVGADSPAERAEYHRLVAALFELAATDARVSVVDAPSEASALGERATDRRLWFHFEAPYSRPLLERIADGIVAAVATRRGLARKVLVVDCDDTLWGGVVGEEGLAGIALGRSTPAGRPFLAFHSQLKALKDRGILLAIVSKNEPADVHKVLDGHPESLLRRTDFVAERINWEDKPRNLRAIAAELGLGLDSFVFIDDSDFECGLVRATLPEVDVLQVPKVRSDLPLLLSRYAGFDPRPMTEADRQRAADYAAERLRREERERHPDLGDFLSSLRLSVRVCRPDTSSVPRLAQLSQRTNQFNLTTPRWTDAEVLAMLADDARRLFELHVEDRFGSQGLTGFAVATLTPDRIALDALMLSCRVLGRGVEDAFLAAVVESLRGERGDLPVVARWGASAKNAQTRWFLRTAGFEVTEADDQSASFTLAPARQLHRPSHIEVRP
jgi:FkbH-like protein